jgi:hypothetical protein
MNSITPSEPQSDFFIRRNSRTQNSYGSHSNININTVYPNHSRIEYSTLGARNIDIFDGITIKSGLGFENEMISTKYKD